MADNALMRWIGERSHPVRTLDPAAPLDDLHPFRDVVGDASVVGLGEATRFAHEVFAFRFRLLRYLVERLGFRALALEEDWTKGRQLDEYVCGGAGDPLQIVDEDAWKVWRTEEFIAALGWLRSHNQRHPGDPVRIVGIDCARVQPSAYDAVLGHVRREAPDRLAEVESHYAVLRPAGRVTEHIAWITGHPHPEELIERADRVRELVEDTPSAEEASWNARVIAGFHRYHARGVKLDPSLFADGVIRWHRRTGARIVYWGGTGHSAVYNASEGALLREHFGAGYLSVGMTFGHGELLWPVTSPSPELAESALRDAEPDAFFLDLRGEAPSEVRPWLDSPTRTRVIGPRYEAARDAEFSVEGASLRTLFDAVAHVREVGPVRFV